MVDIGWKGLRGPQLLARMQYPYAVRLGPAAKWPIAVAELVPSGLRELPA